MPCDSYALATALRPTGAVIGYLPGLRLCATFIILGSAVPRTEAFAQAGAAVPGAPGSDTAPAAAAPDTLSSPRAALRQFLARGEAREFDEAANFLDLTAAQERRGAELARRIHAVIERRITVDLDSVSSLPGGDPTDGAPAAVDRAGRLRLEDGSVIRPLALRRTAVDGESRWLITGQTVSELSRMYLALDESWTNDRLPPWLQEAGPLGIPRWKWIGWILGVPLVWLVTLTLSVLLRAVFLHIAHRTRFTWDAPLVRRLRGPVRLFIASLLAGALPVVLESDAETTETIWRVLRGVTVASLFWMVLRAVRLVQQHLVRQAWVADRTTARTIVPLLGRTVSVAILLVAVLVTISQFGYPVGTVLAGLGLGGLVVALAAQKTVENLFGSVSLAAGRVFRVGDWVRIDDVQGSVEQIGLRSTHIRTLDRTLVKIPNGQLADSRIESFGERDRIRLFTTLALPYDTPPATIRRLLGEIEALLRSHPRVWQDLVIVRLAGVGRYSLDITVQAWLMTADYGEFEIFRQDVLLGILELVERAGARLAVPVQITRLEHEPEGPVGRRME